MKSFAPQLSAIAALGLLVLAPALCGADGTAKGNANDQTALYSFPNTSASTSGHALIALPKDLTAVGLADDGTVILQSLTETDKFGYRWKNGELTPLDLPAEIAANPGNYFLLPPQTQNPENNYPLPWCLTNRMGGVAASYYDLTDPGVDEVIIGLVWPPGQSEPVRVVGPRLETEFYSVDWAWLRLFNAHGKVWGAMTQLVVLPNGFGAAGYAFGAWTPPAYGLAELVVPAEFVESYGLNLDPVSAIAVNASGVLVGHRNVIVGGVAQPRYFVGSPMAAADEVAFEPRAINDAGWVLGRRTIPAAQDILWRKSPLQEIVLPAGEIAELDDANNLHGHLPDGTKVMWTTNPVTRLSDPATGTYAPIAYVRPLLPSGWTSSLKIVPGSPGLKFGTGTFDDPATPAADPETRAFLLVPAALAVDADRDGTIKIASEDESDVTSAAKPYRFWINDDDDRGPASGDDIPGRALNKADSINRVVDSVRDLVDFFPLFLDIKQLLGVLPHTTADITYKLKKADGALNFVYTNKTKAQAVDYQKQVLATGFGPSFAQAAGSATTQQITAAGVDLAEFGAAFLDGVKNNDWGVILIEGRIATTAPLRLVVEKNGTEIAEVAVNLRISPVEEMFRHVNLTGVPSNYDDTNPSLPETPEATRTGTPSNWPDTQANGKYFVFLHGYNVDAQKARGWQAEVFKRLHALGSKARFVGVTWHGATGLDYHKAVYHAFQTGDAIADALCFTDNADVTVAAHSLGNMVISHAIQTGGFTPTRYYMINGATPLEAYASGDAGLGESANMTELAWRGYDPRLYMANWHTLFPRTDNRSALTWRNLFASVRTRAVTHNFYSEEEEVVADADQNTSASIMATLLNQGFNVSLGAWKAQELVKGVNWFTSLVSLFMERGQAGWGFNRDWYKQRGQTNSGPILSVRFPSETSEAEVPTADLKTKPFFGAFLEPSIISANATAASAKAGETKVKYDLLARGIPAMSNATAANVMVSLGNDRNFPMHSTGRDAANGALPTPENKWRHSDFKDVGLPYVYPMYEAMISRGNLK